MNRNSKKGFTIVELIIVIAVIAVLAAVLIPTFSNLIKKANEAKDTALVSNLNKGLKMSSKDFATMHEALQAVEENVGIDVEKISAVATDSEILWDSVNNCFVYLKSGDTKPTYIPDSQKTSVADNEQYKYWEIVETARNDAIYSQYLAGDNRTEAVTVNTGFDAGKNANLQSVTYANTESQSVVIRTNGGELVVDAGNATVAHYGKAASVKIEAVAPNSYHEFGKVVGDIEIKKGRIELAATAEVTTVLVSSAAENAVKVDVVSGAQVGTVAPTTDSAKKDVEASTSIPTESKQTDVVTVNEDFAGGLGTERSPYLIANGTHFDNINKLANDMISGKSYFFKQVSDITVDKVYKANGLACEYDGNGYKLTADFSSGEYVSLFAAYQTTGFVSFKNMNIVMGSVGVNLLACADWGTSFGATFDNITFNSTKALTSVNCSNFGFILFDALYTKGEGVPTYTFANITNNVNLQNEGSCTGFIVGSGPDFATKTIVNYTNCVNNGNITGSNNVGFLYGNSSYISTVKDTGSEINVNNCKNKGILSATNDNCIVAFAPKLDELNVKYQNSVGGSFLSTNYFTGKAFTVNQTGNAFTINTEDSSVAYKLVFNVGATYWTKSGKAWTESDVALIASGNREQVWEVSNGKKYLVDLTVDIAANGALTNSFKAYDKKTAQAKGITATSYTDGYAIVVKDGVTYLVFDVTADTYINCDVSLLVYAYDANNNLLGIKKVK